MYFGKVDLCSGTPDSSLGVGSVTVGPFLMIFGGQHLVTKDEFEVTGGLFILDTSTREISVKSNELVSMHWTEIRPNGKGPHARAVCVLNVVEDKIIFSHGYYRGSEINGIDRLGSCSDIFSLKINEKAYGALKRWNQL